MSFMDLEDYQPNRDLAVRKENAKNQKAVDGKILAFLSGMSCQQGVSPDYLLAIKVMNQRFRELIGMPQVDEI